MKEYEFTCLRCGNTWFESKRNIRESKALEREIKFIKFKLHFTLQANKKRRRLVEQLSQIRLGQTDFSRCKVCGSRNAQRV